MSSPFDALDAQLSEAVLSAFGERTMAMLRPRTRSEFAEGADATRPPRQIRGVFTAAQGETALRGAATNAEFSGVTRLSAFMAEFWVSAADLAAIPYRIAKGDRLELAGRPGSPVYSISDIHPTSFGDANLILVEGGE